MGSPANAPLRATDGAPDIGLQPFDDQVRALPISRKPAFPACPGLPAHRIHRRKGRLLPRDDELRADRSRTCHARPSRLARTHSPQAGAGRDFGGHARADGGLLRRLSDRVRGVLFNLRLSNTARPPQTAPDRPRLPQTAPDRPRPSQTVPDGCTRYRSCPRWPGRTITA